MRHYDWQNQQNYKAEMLLWEVLKEAYQKEQDPERKAAIKDAFIKVNTEIEWYDSDMSAETKASHGEYHNFVATFLDK